MIKMDAVSSKNVKNEYSFVLPIFTSLLHTPRGASAKAVLWITWPKKARQTTLKMCFPENENETYIKTATARSLDSLRSLGMTARGLRRPSGQR